MTLRIQSCSNMFNEFKPVGQDTENEKYSIERDVMARRETKDKTHKRPQAGHLFFHLLSSGG